MKQIFLSGIVLVLLGFNSCHLKTKDKTLSPPAPQQEGIAIKISQLASDKDLVCGMYIEEGSIADTASYEQKLYGFCASECKAEFLKSPQTYLSQK